MLIIKDEFLRINGDEEFYFKSVESSNKRLPKCIPPPPPQTLNPDSRLPTPDSRLPTPDSRILILNSKFLILNY